MNRRVGAGTRTGLLAAASLALAGGAEGAGGIRGSVLDRAGRAVPGAEIRLQRAGELPGPGPVGAVADERGAFFVGEVGRGEYFVWASAFGFVDGRAGPLRVGEGEVACEIRLPWLGSGALEGRILDHRARAVAGAVVEVEHPAHALGTPLRTATDEEGRYRFAGVTLGQSVVTLRTRAPGAPPRGEVLRRSFATVKEGETTTLDMDLPPTDGALAGRARDSRGVPLGGGRVEALYEPEPYDTYAFEGSETVADERGAFRVVGLVPGKYRLRFFAKREGEVERFLGEVFPIEPREEAVDYRVPEDPPVLLRGTVVVLETGEPLPGSEFTLQSGDRLLPGDRSDGFGRFSFGVTLAEDLPNILRVVHRRFPPDERWLRREEVLPDGTYPPFVFAATRARPEGLDPEKGR